MIREPYIGMPIQLGGSGGFCGGPGVPVRPQAPSRPQMPPVQTPPVPEMQQPQAAGFDGQLLGSLPIAMTYTPMQQWKTTYSAEEALQRGTLFPELDLPFEGKMWRGGMRR